MTQAVTELIVQADGALAQLNRFDKGMSAAGATAEKTAASTHNVTGAVASFEERMAKARAAIERGNAVTMESVARKTADQRAWEKWAGTVDRTQALRIRLEREAAQAAVAATNAVNLGYATQEQALVTLAALEQRHVAQLQGVTDQHQRAIQATSAHALANDNLAQSMSRVAAKGGGGSFQTSNIAAQFQDIGVTAAMGMNPIMIALQQGTQLSAVLNTMQSPLRGLATAFMSIINPVSLLTIGFVALGAVAIQWFMGAKSGAEDAASALEAHNKWLDANLQGYESVRNAAKAAADEALRLPQEAVLSNAGAKATTDAQAYADQVERTITAQAALNQQTVLWLQYQSEAARMYPDDIPRQDRFQGLIDMAAALNEVEISASSSRAEIEAFVSQATVLMNAAGDPAIAAMAKTMVDAGREMLSLRSIASSSALAVYELSGAAKQSAASIMASANAAWQAVKSYSVAAGAAVNYANAMRDLGALIPEVAAAQAQMQNLEVAQTKYSDALSSNRALLKEHSITQAEFSSRQAEAAALYQRARDQVTGLTDATKALSDAERQASVGAMAPREAALERIRDKYTDIEDALRKAGAGPDAFTRSATAMNQELATSNVSFDEMAAKASGAGKALEKAASDYERLTEGARQSIEQLTLQAQTMDMATQAAAAMRYEQEMLNKAANDNITLMPEQRDEIAALAVSMAEAEAALAGVQFALGNPDPWQEAMNNIANLDAALATGALSWEQYGDAAFRANSGAAASVLGLASGMTGALSQMFQDNKAFAVANAVVSTAEAVMKALSTYGPTPWGFAAAGIAAATGAAQIATIMSAQKGGGSISRPGGGGGSVAASAAPAPQKSQDVNISLHGRSYSRDDVRELLEQIGGALGDGMTLNVKAA